MSWISIFDKKIMELEQRFYESFSTAYSISDREKNLFVKEVEEVFKRYLDNDVSFSNIRDEIIYIYGIKHEIDKLSEIFVDRLDPCLFEILSEAHIYCSTESILMSDYINDNYINDEKSANLLINRVRLTNAQFKKKQFNFLDFIIEDIEDDVNEYYKPLIDELFYIIENNYPKTSKQFIKLINKNSTNLNFDIIKALDKFTKLEGPLAPNVSKKSLDELINKCIENVNEINEVLEDNIHENFNINVDLPFGDLSNGKIETRKIFNYREIEALAIKSGFQYKWSNASSHKIYEHSKSKKCIVIPCHNLGLGLSIKIQKQIVKNSK